MFVDPLLTVLKIIPEMCKKHAVIAVRRLKLTRLHVDLIREILSTTCKLCIIVTDLTSVDEKLNMFVREVKVPVLYMADPRAEYTIIDLLPVQVRSGSVDYRRLLSLLQDNVNYRKAILEKNVSLVVDRLCQTLRELEDAIHGLSSVEDMSIMYERIYDLKCRLGYISEILTCTIPTVPEQFNHVKTCLTDFVHIFSLLEELDKLVLEHRVGITQFDFDRARRFLNVLREKLREAGNRAISLLQSASEIVDTSAHEHVLKVLDSILFEFRLVAGT